LSAVDPDGFASRFGHQVVDGNFSRGLSELLTDDKWQKQGERGYTFVRNIYTIDKVIDAHIKIYKQLLA
jgi:hypothetical protein